MTFLVHTAYQDYGEGGSGNSKTGTTRQELFHSSDAPSNEQQPSFQALVWCLDENFELCDLYQVL